MYLILISVLVIFIGGLVSTLAPNRNKSSVFAFFYITGAISICVLALTELQLGVSHKTLVSMPFPIGDVTLVLDPLSSFFLLFIAVMGIPAVLYAIGYLKPYIDRQEDLTAHYFFLGTFFAAILVIPLIQNAIAFLIAWEIMSLSSFFLVIFSGKKEEILSAGINYLITMHISVIFLVIGFLCLSLFSNDYNFLAFSKYFETHTHLSSIIFIIFFIGFGIKGGFVPFHAWLPKAHPAAPCHISGIMSGIMIKLGIYGILRLILLIKTPSLELSYFMIIISIITALYGIANAIAQSDIKKLLAYSSIENIGIIGVGIGIGMLGLSYKSQLVAFLGFTGSFLHLLNHSIFKELLFFSVGSIYTKTHTNNSEKLGGLIKKMPCTAVMFLVGSIAIIGLPPFNGFVSEFLIYLSLLHGFELHNLNLLILFSVVLGSLALIGTMALLCFSKVFGIVFLGHPRTALLCQLESDVPLIMLVPKLILTLLIVVIGLFPQTVLDIIMPPVSIFVPSSSLCAFSFFSVKMMRFISFSSFILLLMIVITFGVREYIIRKKTILHYKKTWDCGYQSGSSRMQYSAHSYVAPFIKLLGNLLAKKVTTKKPVGLFPEQGYFKVRFNDSLEFYTIRPLIKGTQNLLNKFLWIQSGDTQIYILYGFIFLIISIIGVFLF